ncbi:MAG: hypothetical protein ACTHLW_16195 [Verrucomicrobiota bacterium]
MQKRELIAAIVRLSGSMPDVEAHKRWLGTLSIAALNDRLGVIRKQEPFDTSYRQRGWYSSKKNRTNNNYEETTQSSFPRTEVAAVGVDPR